MMKSPYSNSEDGSVIILTIWTVMFLGALAVAVSTHVGSSIVLAARMRDETAGLAAALAGAEKSAMLIMNDTNAWDGFNEKWSGNEDLFRDVTLGEGVCSIIKPEFRGASGAELDDAEIYGMSDEERKVNVNKADLELMSALIETVGNLKKEDARRLSACIIDWRDENDEVLTDGAEKGYYMSLSQPYECRNAAFMSLPELLLVKGMTRTLYNRISPYLTVFGHGKVNINTAGKAVLFSVAVAGSGGRTEGCSALVARIEGYRKAGNSFTDRNPNAMALQLNRYKRMTGQESMVLSHMIKYVALNATCFRGISAGGIQEGKKMSMAIEFVFDRSRQQFVYWKD